MNLRKEDVLVSSVANAFRQGTLPTADITETVRDVPGAPNKEAIMGNEYAVTEKVTTITTAIHGGAN